jgi:hypothetical protein
LIPFWFLIGGVESKKIRIFANSNQHQDTRTTEQGQGQPEKNTKVNFGKKK